MDSRKCWVPMRIFVIFLLTCEIQCHFLQLRSYDFMKCSYGERGSLTATCTNATPSYFKHTLYKFDQLDETLRCVDCVLTTIESNSFDLSGNRILNLELQNSQIETLKPKAFMGLIFLKNLNMSENKIRSILPETFVGTKKIETLDLSNNEISILAESAFAELKELNNLYLQNNKIFVLDLKAFNGLVNLRVLDLSFNSISALNVTLQNLTSLQVLKLKHNFIHQLTGEEFSTLNNLTDLDLSYNLLTDDHIINMQNGNNLKRLSLAHNKIVKLWFDASYLHSLEELDLESNNISVINDLPDEGRMYNLHSLQLAYNNLEQIRTGQFSGLPQLRTLNCSHNQIKKLLITGIFSLQNLQSLDLSHNMLSDLDYTALLSRVPSLAFLKLEDNLLPCALEEDMEKTFEEDNFKFVLYDNTVESKKCVDKAVVKSSLGQLGDCYVDNPQDRPLSGVDVFIFVLISLIIVAVGVLFYLQYLFFKGVQLIGPTRVASTVQLITSDADNREDDFETLSS